MYAYKSFPMSARDSLESAIKLIPNKPEPYLYLSFDILHNRFERESSPATKTIFLE